MNAQQANNLKSRSRTAFDAQAPTYDTGMEGEHARKLYPHVAREVARATFQIWRVLAAGGTLVVGDVWQPAPGRAIMNAWMPHSSEGDVRIYSESEMREILGTWFDGVTWHRIGTTACIVIARKER